MAETKQSSKNGPLMIIVLAIALAILHQDFWWWDSSEMVFGFLPIGLAYHALFSLAAAGLWALAIKVAWPYDWEAMAEEPADESTFPDKAPDKAAE